LAAEEVIVPAGSFPDALKIGYRVVSSPIYEGYIWLVPGTGIVAQEQSGYRSELTSYTRSDLLAPLPTSLTTEEIEKILNISVISRPIQKEQTAQKIWLSSHIPHVLVSSLLLLGCAVFLVMLARTRRDIDLQESDDVQEGELILAQAMVKEDMLEDASRILQRLAEKHPEWPDIAALLGSAYYRLGKADEACLELKRAITLNPDMVSARLELAKIYLELNDPSNALVEVEPVILANPDFADAIYLKGEIYMVLGEIDAAIETFRSALSLNPDFANARKGLERALSSN
jgi:tetratricopeptide (TPR) repeat protein